MRHTVPFFSFPFCPSYPWGPRPTTAEAPGRAPTAEAPPSRKVVSGQQIVEHEVSSPGSPTPVATGVGLWGRREGLRQRPVPYLPTVARKIPEPCHPTLHSSLDYKHTLAVPSRLASAPEDPTCQHDPDLSAVIFRVQRAAGWLASPDSKAWTGWVRAVVTDRVDLSTRAQRDDLHAKNK